MTQERINIDKLAKDISFVDNIALDNAEQRDAMSGVLQAAKEHLEHLKESYKERRHFFENMTDSERRIVMNAQTIERIKKEYAEDDESKKCYHINNDLVVGLKEECKGCSYLNICLRSDYTTYRLHMPCRLAKK